MTSATATASRPFPHVLIRASAGTGKTFQLSNRYIGLLLADVPSESILASTFTRKAAGEILERVMLRLAAAALDEQKCRELAGHLAAPDLNREACLGMVRRLTRHLHRVRIGTLDSFFGQIARSFSLELGIPPGWRIVDDFVDGALRDEAIGLVLQQEEVRDLQTLMNLMTKGEVTRSVGETLRSTVNDLYEIFQDTDESAWFSLSRPTPLAVEELETLLADLRAAPLGDKRFQKARDSDVAIAAADDWETFISKGLAAKVLAGVEEFYGKPIDPPIQAIYQRLLQHAKAILVRRVADQTESTYKLLEKFHVEYQRLKREQGVLRFDDVTRRVAALAQETAPQVASKKKKRGPKRREPEQLAYRLDGQIQHLLLDEFQDTAPAQWQSIRPVARRAVSAETSGTFFCVGDVKQAIYGWRGGVAEIFDVISGELREIDEQSLNRSFRSSPTVIDTVNQIFAGLSGHPNLDRAASALLVWCRRFETHDTARHDLPGYACLTTAPADDDDATTPKEALFEFTADQVARIVRETPGRSVGVLVRKNETVGRLIHALRRRQIHASEEGGNPLTDSAGVLLILSLLRLADHPGDTVARFHVATSPLGKALRWERIRDDNADAIAQQVRRWLLEQGYGRLLYEWTRLLAPGCNRREASRLTQLVELAYEYQPQATLRTDDFIAYVEQKRVADPTAADVRVMTVHQSKGLEFDVVVLPELDVPLIGQPSSFVVHRESPTSPVTRVCRYANQSVQQLLPEAVQQMFEDATDRSVAESLCVLYVAVTRAVHALHLIVRPASPKENALPRTYGGLLRAALAPGLPATPETTLFEAGDRDWRLRLPAAPTPRPVTPPVQPPPPDAPAAVQTPSAATTPSAAAEPPRPKIVLATIRDRRRRGLGRLAPSDLEGRGSVRLASLFDDQHAAARRRGTLIHAWFEAIEWLDAGAPTEQLLRQIAAEQVTDMAAHSLDLDDLLKQFRAMLKRPAVARILSRKSQTVLDGQTLKVEREYAFALREGERLMSGSIDRLVLKFSGTKPVEAEVLDFKTDQIPLDAADQAMTAKVEHYRPQMQAYRHSVGKLMSLPPERIATRLVFVGSGRIVDVP